MGGEQCHMTVKRANGTTKTTTARTAEDAPAALITGRRVMRATIKIPIDRLPDAPEPTLPHHTEERPAGMTFALSWAEEQYRRRADRSEEQRRRRAEGKS